MLEFSGRPYLKKVEVGMVGSWMDRNDSAQSPERESLSGSGEVALGKPESFFVSVMTKCRVSLLNRWLQFLPTTVIKNVLEWEHPDGSGVEHLPSAQGMTPGVLGSSPASGSLHGACFSLCLCLCPPLSLSVSLMNK